MQQALEVSGRLFFGKDLQEEYAVKKLEESLLGADDGELFLEYTSSESLVFDDGALRSASHDISSGFGLRAVLGEQVAYSHSTVFDKQAIDNASEIVFTLRDGYAISAQDMASRRKHEWHDTDKLLYLPHNPVTGMEFVQKLKLLQELDSYIRAKEPLISQVSLSISSEYQVVRIMRPGEPPRADIRPLSRLNISVILERNGRKERGTYGLGGRADITSYLQEPQKYADEALRQARVNLDSVPVKAGQMPVVLGHGWPGVMLHEAVGHGLEGDFNRKKTSVFSGMMGSQVASKGVTVVDNGRMEGRRGSLNIDDEGTQTAENILIEDGVLKSYMHDRQSARLMGAQPTGNGRRESFEYAPLPRMTNTYMLPGDATQEEMISQVQNGIFAVNFGGGQVDITSGNFVFSMSEAYRIEGGRVTAPLKGATLIGTGADAMRNIRMIGDDLQLDSGVGMCGKGGQGVPVGVGQPSVLIDGLTIGGTEV